MGNQIKFTNPPRFATIGFVSASIISLAAVTSANASAHSEQTIDTAHEFLERTSMPLKLGYLELTGYQTRNVRSRVELRKGSHDCVTIFEGQEDYEAFIPVGSQWKHFSGKIRNDRFISWGSVAKIDPQGASVFVTTNLSYKFTYPSSDLATRAAFAMEFLRVACDPTADLAF